MFTVVITEFIETPTSGIGVPEKTTPVKRYEATVDMLDLAKVVQAVMAKPRKPRERKVQDGK